MIFKIGPLYIHLFTKKGPYYSHGIKGRLRNAESRTIRAYKLIKEEKPRLAAWKEGENMCDCGCVAIALGANFATPTGFNFTTGPYDLCESCLTKSVGFWGKPFELDKVRDLPKYELCIARGLNVIPSKGKIIISHKEAS